MNNIFKVGDRVEVASKYKDNFTQYSVGKIIELQDRNGMIISSINFNSAEYATVKWCSPNITQKWKLYGLTKLLSTDSNLICKKIK